MLLHKTLARGNYFTAEEGPLMARKPPARAYASGWTRAANDFTSLGHEYILRACRLRQAGRIGIVLVERGKYYIAANPSDPWGSKEPITCEDLRDLIDSIDVAV
jgi:hypothetical protein